MFIYIASGVLVILLLFYFFWYRQLTKQASIIDDTLMTRLETERKHGRRGLGILIYFFLWGGIAFGLTGLLMLYTNIRDHQFPQMIHHNSTIILYLILVSIPSLFFASNIMELMKHKVPLIYNEIKLSVIIFSKKRNKFYLRSYPQLILIEIGIFIISSLLCVANFNAYIYTTDNEVVINRLEYSREIAYRADDVWYVRVSFIADNQNVMHVNYDVYFEGEAITFSNYIPTRSTYEAQLKFHQFIIDAIQSDPDITIDYNDISDLEFNESMSHLNEQYANFLNQIRLDYEAITSE